jgi:hypothetical protein
MSWLELSVDRYLFPICIDFKVKRKLYTETEIR